MERDATYFRRSVVRQILRVIIIIYGIGTVLLVETCIRLMTSNFGNSTITTFSVISTFVISFVISVLLYKKKGKRIKEEIRFLIALNLGVGFFLVAFFLLLPLFSQIYRYIYLPFYSNMFFLYFFEFLFTFIILSIPGVLTGSSLFILIRFLTKSSNDFNFEVGVLFSLFILGIAFGYLFICFFIFHVLGFKISLLLVAVIYLFCALVIKMLLEKIEPKFVIESKYIDKQLRLFSQSTALASNILRHTLIISFAIFISLSISYIILWKRELDFILGSDFYFHKITAMIVFLGISIAGFIFIRKFIKFEKYVSILSGLPIASGILGLGSLFFIPIFVKFNKILWSFVNFEHSWAYQILIYFFDAVLIFLVPALIIGASIIFVNRIVFLKNENRWQEASNFISIVAMVTLVGLFMISFLLLPGFGIQKSIIFITYLNFFVGLVVFFIYAIQHSRNKKISFVFFITILIFTLSLLIPPDIISNIYSCKISNSKIVYLKEGINSTLSVHKINNSNDVFLATNGVVVTDKPINQFGSLAKLVNLPVFLHPNPDTILITGFGDGSIIKNLNINEFSMVDYVVKNKLVMRLFPEFLSYLKEAKNVRIIQTDRSNYVKYTHNSYDVIINDYNNSLIFDNRNLLCQKYFSDCKKLLKSSGVLACYIPIYRMSIEDFKIILRTFQFVFPQSSVWYDNNSVNRWMVLIGFVDSNFQIDFSDFYNNINNESSDINLEDLTMRNIYEVLDCFIMGPNVIKKLTRGVRLNRKNHPILEFSASKTPDEPNVIYQILQLFKSYRESVFPFITNIDSSIARNDVVKFIIETYFNGTDNVFNAICSQLLGKKQQALKFYQQAYMTNRLDRAAKNYVDKYFNPLLIATPKSAFEFVENAKIYFQKTEYEKAVKVLEKAISIDSNYAPAYFAMGINYEILGEAKKAKEMYQKTLELKPGLENVKMRIENIKVKSDE